MSVCIQAGHYPSGGGAPGEAAWAYELAHRIAAQLEAAGVQVVVVGAWNLDNSNPPPQVRQDHALFVSLHYDADIYADRTGCFAGRATNDPMGDQSDKAIRYWEEVYPALTGIPLRKERMNPNVTDYYAFRVTSANTPGILIEHGVGQGLDHATLFDRIGTVAAADANAILQYLGVTAHPLDEPFSSPTPTEDEELALTDEERQMVELARQGVTKAVLDTYFGRAAEIGRELLAEKPGTKTLTTLTAKRRRTIGAELAAFA